MYAISFPAHLPTKPGLVRVTDGSGTAFPIEVWDVPADQVGSFLVKVPEPLAIGTVRLEDNSTVYGFICEGYVASCKEGVQDITDMGSWLAYVSH